MKKRGLYLLIGLLALVSCVKETKVAPTIKEGSAKIATQGTAHLYLSEEMAEALENGTKSEAFNEALEAIGASSAERLFPYAGEYEGRTRREGLHRWYRVQYSGTATKASEQLADIEGVELVSMPRKIRPAAIFNDYFYSLQWGIQNQAYDGPDINVTKVWSKYTTGSSDVVVAIIDDGVDLTHEDLAYNCGDTHYNFVDKSTEIVGGGHGTHVAGVIGAVSNNEKGISGIAGGNYARKRHGVTLMSCQIFEGEDDEDEEVRYGDQAEAIKWAADNGAVLANCSWGFSYDEDGDGEYNDEELEEALNDKIDYYPSTKAAIDYFIKYAGCDDAGNQKSDSKMKGGVMFFAAGNDGIANGVPANYEEVIAVGAIDTLGKVANFSNHGPWVDIAAPGTKIASTAYGEYYYMGGTSMAAPFATGVAALLVSYYGGEGFTAAKLKEMLIQGANYDYLDDNTVVGPLLDALGAMEYSLTEHIKAYPNPCTDVLYVTNSAEQVEADVRLVSHTGAVVYNSKLTISSSKPGTIDVSGFAPGRYILSVDTGEGPVEIKVVKI